MFITWTVFYQVRSRRQDDTKEDEGDTRDLGRKHGTFSPRFHATATPVFDLVSLPATGDHPCKQFALRNNQNSHYSEVKRAGSSSSHTRRA